MNQKKTQILQNSLDDVVFIPVNSKEANGQGMGIGGNRQGTGGTSTCYCPECGYEIDHDRGKPCINTKCPECGSLMQGFQNEEKVYLEEWRDGGTTDVMENPEDNWQTLFHELQILGNAAWPKISNGEEWGDWSEDEVKKYFADVVDALRRAYFPLVPPSEGEAGYNSSYWELYRESEEYMDSNPPSEGEIEEWDELRDEVIKSETFKPPQYVADEAQRALDAREKYGDRVEGGTKVGWTRANQLAKRKPVSLDTIGRMVSFFARHDGNQKVNEDADIPWEDAGYTSWIIWGGDPGRKWSNKIWDRSNDDKSQSYSVLLESESNGNFYVLTEDAIEKGWMPPKGFSCLTKDIENNIPTKYKYWKMSDRDKAEKARNILVRNFDLSDLGIPTEKQIAENPIGTKIDPEIKSYFPPSFDRYVELNPFSNSALWSEMDCRKYTKDIQILEDFKEMDIDFVNGLDWNAKKRAEATKPSSPNNRFWKFQVKHSCIDKEDLKESKSMVEDINLKSDLRNVDSETTFYFLDNPNQPLITLKKKAETLDGDILLSIDIEKSKKSDIVFDGWKSRKLASKSRALYWKYDRKQQSKSTDTVKLEGDLEIKSEDERIVGGIVYQADRYDADGEWATKDTVREAMYYFMEQGLKFSVDHDRPIKADVLECFQAEEDTIKGGGTVPEGSWYVSARVKDKDAWDRVKKGELKGFSWEGKVKRERGKTI